MRQRGRVPAEVFQLPGVREELPRPAAPAELTEAERAEWDAIVGRLPADWFPVETHGLLVQYCRHRTAARLIGEVRDTIGRKRPLDAERYNKLAAMLDRETRAIMLLATKMRLTQQSSYDRTKRKPSSAPTPWDGE